jgi:hypothetical protein
LHKVFYVNNLSKTARIEFRVVVIGPIGAVVLAIGWPGIANLRPVSPFSSSSFFFWQLHIQNLV